MNETSDKLCSTSISGFVEEEVFIDYVLNTGLTIDVKREFTRTELRLEFPEIQEDYCPYLLLGTSVFMNGCDAICIVPPLGEPTFVRKKKCIVIRKTQQKIFVTGDMNLLWSLLRKLDGKTAKSQILKGFDHDDIIPASKFLSALYAIGAVSFSDQRTRRFLHKSTKKGVLSGTDIAVTDVLKLVTDGNYRSYPNSEHILLHYEIPNKLSALHSIFRSRRSYRNYNGQSISRKEFEAIIYCSCGITGKSEWENREVKLRSYPSSGGLYAVEIYPVIFSVTGIEPGIYHYCPVQNRLENIRPNMNRFEFIQSALPQEREMLAQVAVMFCLTGNFLRHEIKYGEGGYRMLVAEAGHISQNLVLASTALGLQARPFGGVFDDLLNEELGLFSEDEQFLLSVICGHCGP